MVLKKLGMDFSVCKLADLLEVNLNQEFMFLSKTDEEISLVCASGLVPANATIVEEGWKALRIEGVLDFGMIGVIAKISNILASADISIFVISTYNTDYILLKGYDYEKSIALLEKNNYQIVCPSHNMK